MPIPLFDAHCDTLSRLALWPDAHLDGSGGQWSLGPPGVFAPWAQVFALYWDSRRPDAGAMIERELAAFQRECARFPERIAPCRTGAQAQEAVDAGRLAAFLSLEGAELMGGTREGLRRAWGAGVRMVNLTWNRANVLSGSHCEEPERGLSAEGRAYVRGMNALGMLTDVSHLSDAGFWDVMALTPGPVIASHSDSRSVFFHSRNLTDAQFTAIMKHQGIVGLNAYARFLGPDGATEEDLIAHLEHFLALGGADTVALGGDWDGCDELPAGFSGVWDWAVFYETLLRRNYSETLVRNLFFYNFMRTVKRVCVM